MSGIPVRFKDLWRIYKSLGGLLFKKYVIYLFIEKGMEGGKEGEKHQCGVASHMPLTGNLACNPDMCPDWELNQWPFGFKAGPQFTEPHQPGLFHCFYVYICLLSLTTTCIKARWKFASCLLITVYIHVAI